MHISKKQVIALSAAVLMILVSCKKKPKAGYKDTYKHFYGYDPKSFNYAHSNNGEDTAHFANFVDGLYEGDRYGVRFLPALADGEPEPFEWSEGGQSGTGYKVKVKRNIPWVNSKGEKTTYGNLKPTDFETVAKLSLNYRLNNSAYSTAYMYINFIRGAEAFFENSISSSNPDFSKVGIKANDNDFTISYQLIENLNVESFKSALTYSCFLPINAQFYTDTNNKGVKFGVPTNLDSILYNGGYLMKKYVSSYIIEYEKNPFYWDADSIKTPKISLINYPADAKPSLSREFFEAGQIDGFSPTARDVVGYKKYVTGKKGNGTFYNPDHKEVQVIENVESSTIWYQSFNLNRDGFDANAAKNADDSFKAALTNNSGYSNVNNGLSSTADQIVNTRKALRNKNFRLGLLHSFPREIDLYSYTPHNPKQWMRNTMTMKNFTTTDTNVDYVDLIADHYATAKGGSKEEAANKIKDGSDAFYDLNKADEYFSLARAELSDVRFPVALVNPYPHSQDTQMTFEEIEKFYNGGSKGASYTLPQSDYGRFNNTVKLITLGISSMVYDQVMDNGLFDMITVGWTPDYADPLTYVSTHCTGGAMTDQMNKLAKNDPETAVVFASVDESLANARSAATKDDRLKYIAQAEYRLIYEEGLILPGYASNIGTAITVSRIVPYQTQRNPVGLGSDKYKGILVQYRTVTNEQRAEWKKKFDEEKAEILKNLNK